MGTQVATLGGGCFWCTEAVYARLPGVLKVAPGYAGGHVVNPSYEAVCQGTTGHAEVIQVTFDPAVIDYAQILSWFWKSHDPTTPNRQGHDVGTQYRSIILYTDEEQRTLALDSMSAAQSEFRQPIVTEVEPLTDFFPAEDYHHDYYARNQRAAYCRAVIEPKLQKLKLS